VFEQGMKALNFLPLQGLILHQLFLIRILLRILRITVRQATMIMRLQITTLWELMFI
jgi:hypothetical protein